MSIGKLVGTGVMAVVGLEVMKVASKMNPDRRRKKKNQRQYLRF